MIKAIIFDMYGTIVEDSRRVVAEAADVLAELNGEFRLALCTSCGRSSAERILGSFDLADFFEVMVCDEDVSRSKPDPECYELTVEKLGLEASECLVVEDSEAGLHAAKEAGMQVVIRKAGHNKHGNFTLADHFVSDLNEVAEIAKKCY